MDLTLLDTLRYKIEFGKDLSEVYAYFLDNFGEHEEFLDLSVPTHNELLEAIMGQVAGAALKTNRVVLRDLRLLLVPDHEFIHGGCFIGGRLANVIYCDDIRKGVMAITLFGTSRTDFCRFSAETMPGQPPSGTTSFNH